ncbi:MAG: hypothetical protein ACLTT1_17750 [[Clostridium] scindens]
MLNLLKSDFYKLGKARYFWVCLILTMALAAGTVFLMDFTYKMAGEQMAQQVEQKQQAMDENGINVTTQGVPASREELSASRQMVAFFAGNTTADPGGSHLSVRRQRIQSRYPSRTSPPRIIAAPRSMRPNWPPAFSAGSCSPSSMLPSPWPRQLSCGASGM